MAVNLFQGADPSLVTAAARAGFATAPQSYARTFEDVAKGYAKTMEATAGMWKSIFDAGAKIGIAIDKSNRLEAQKSQQIEDLFGTEGAKDIFSELEGFKEERKRLTGIFKDDRKTIIKDGIEIKNENFGKRVNPFSKETKDERRKLQKEMNDYYSALEKIGTDTNNLVNAWTINPQTGKRLVDENQTPLLANEWSNAIIQSRNGKSTANGNRVVLEKNKDGDWAFVMYHDPKKIDKENATSVEGVPGFTMGKASIDDKGRVIGTGGKVIRYSAAEINDLLVPNDEDKNGNSRMQTALNGFYDGLYKSGNGQALLPHQVNELGDFLDKIKTSPKAWKTRNKFTEGGKSWFEEMTTISVKSGGAYGQLGNIINNLSNLSEEDRADLLSGVTDIPGTSKGITADDFTTTTGDGVTMQHEDNYKALTLALFNPGDANYDPMVTGELYKEAQLNNIDAVRTAGWDVSAQNPANITSTTSTTGGISPLKGTGAIQLKDLDGNDIKKVEKSSLNAIAGWMNNRTNIDLGVEDLRFTWDKDKKTYIRNDDGSVVKNKRSLFNLLYDTKNLDITPIVGLYASIADWDGSKWVKNTELEEDVDKPGTMLSRILNPSRYFELK